VFFGLALLMPLALTFAPLMFGFVWAVSLAGIGIRLRNLARST
jgi:hypothetical protein